jgi:hypothetical protein
MFGFHSFFLGQDEAWSRVERKGAEVEGGEPNLGSRRRDGYFRGGTSLGSIYLTMIVPAFSNESSAEIWLT